jgi:hypothetical protein
VLTAHGSLELPHELDTHAQSLPAQAPSFGPVPDPVRHDPRLLHHPHAPIAVHEAQSAATAHGSLDTAHCPPEQLTPAPHAAPHAPQLLASVERFAQPLAQAVRPPVHVHEPPLHA